MRIFRNLFFTLSFLAYGLAFAAGENGEWSENYQAGLETAQKEGKSVLLLFTGSDWCPPCQFMDKNVFGTDAFEEFASEELVLVKADFLRRTPQDATIKAQNAELAEEYGIEAFPTVFILSPEGKILHKEMGAQHRSPSSFIAMVNDATAKS
ncbi:MAG: thioredoxin family protein [Opitutales bacterium]